MHKCLSNKTQGTNMGNITHLVSILSLQKLLIQSSSLPRKIYPLPSPNSTSSNKSPLFHPPSAVHNSAAGRSGESGRIFNSMRREYESPESVAKELKEGSASEFASTMIGVNLNLTVGRGKRTDDPGTEDRSCPHSVHP